MSKCTFVERWLFVRSVDIEEAANIERVLTGYVGSLF